MTALLAATIVYLLAFIYFYPLTFRLVYEGGQAKLWWLPKLCGGFAAPRRLPLSRPGGREAGQSPGGGLFRRKLPRWRPLAMRLLAHTSLDKLDCRLRVGAADPFSSSMLAGLAMAALGSFGAVASAALKRFPAQVRLAAFPSRQNGLNVNAECIFHLRSGDIIGDMIYALWLAIKGRAQNVKRA